jgi:hypothetical protein
VSRTTTGASTFQRPAFTPSCGSTPGASRPRIARTSGSKRFTYAANSALKPSPGRTARGAQAPMNTGSGRSPAGSTLAGGSVADAGSGAMPNDGTRGGVGRAVGGEMAAASSGCHGAAESGTASM